MYGLIIKQQLQTCIDLSGAKISSQTHYQCRWLSATVLEICHPHSQILSKSLKSEITCHKHLLSNINEEPQCPKVVDLLYSNWLDSQCSWFLDHSSNLEDTLAILQRLATDTWNHIINIRGACSGRSSNFWPTTELFGKCPSVLQTQRTNTEFGQEYTSISWTCHDLYRDKNASNLN